jgi:hypothetical protein
MRFFSGVLAIAAVSWALADKWIIRRPATGILLAQKTTG